MMGVRFTIGPVRVTVAAFSLCFCAFFSRLAARLAARSACWSARAWACDLFLATAGLAEYALDDLGLVLERDALH